MLNSVADAYSLGPDIVACVYRPIPDQHLPLLGPIDDQWDLVTWTIVPGDAGLASYVLVLRTTTEASGVPPTEISYDSSFGRRHLALRPGSGPLATPIATALAQSILAIAGGQTAEALPGLMAAVACVPEAEIASASLTAQRPSTGTTPRLRLAGHHAGFYVVGRKAGDQTPPIARVTAITFEGRDDIVTTFELDRPVAGDSFWLLGDGRFDTITIAEERR